MVGSQHNVKKSSRKELRDSQSRCVPPAFFVPQSSNFDFCPAVGERELPLYSSPASLPTTPPAGLFFIPAESAAAGIADVRAGGIATCRSPVRLRHAVPAAADSADTKKAASCETAVSVVRLSGQRVKCVFRGHSAALLPVLDRPQGDADGIGSSLLSQPGLSADRGEVSPGRFPLVDAPARVGDYSHVDAGIGIADQGAVRPVALGDQADNLVSFRQFPGKLAGQFDSADVDFHFSVSGNAPSGEGAVSGLDEYRQVVKSGQFILSKICFCSKYGEFALRTFAHHEVVVANQIGNAIAAITRPGMAGKNNFPVTNAEQDFDLLPIFLGCVCVADVFADLACVDFHHLFPFVLARGVSRVVGILYTLQCRVQAKKTEKVGKKQSFFKSVLKTGEKKLFFAAEYATGRAA